MKEISTYEVAEILKNNTETVIVDVREDREVATGKISGAVHIPLVQLPNRAIELDKDKDYILVCRSGARSFQATMFLESLGYKVSNMVGGMMEWQGEIEAEVGVY